MTRRTGVLAAIAALLTGCSATGALNTLVSSATYRVQQDVAYGPDPRQRLDVYRPLEDRAGGHPVVVFFYGGSWSSGDRADYKFAGEALASGGAIVIVADYRLSPAVRYPEFVRDSARAVKWAFDNAASLGGDPARIYAMGHSAGAYNAAMLALDPRWLGEVGLAPARLAGWIGMAGPYDFLPIGDPRTQVAFRWPDTPPDSQPMVYADRKAPRTLLMAANKDTVVDPQRSTGSLARRLQAAGTDVTLRTFDGVSHVTLMAAMARPLGWMAPVRAETLAFLGLPTAK